MCWIREFSFLRYVNHEARAEWAAAKAKERQELKKRGITEKNMYEHAWKRSYADI